MKANSNQAWLDTVIHREAEQQGLCARGRVMSPPLAGQVLGSAGQRSIRGV